jgi:ribosome-associated heat shock protein Hsp15
MAPAAHISHSSSKSADGDQIGQRLDKWLWHARFTKTRSLAVKLILAGHVRVNLKKASSASKLLHIGDVLTIARPHDVIVVEVLGYAQKREAFALASQLYKTLDPS